MFLKILSILGCLIAAFVGLIIIVFLLGVIAMVIRGFLETWHEWNDESDMTFLEERLKEKPDTYTYFFLAECPRDTDHSRVRGEPHPNCSRMSCYECWSREIPAKEDVNK